MGLANSVALKIAGISSNTVDPDGGMVMRDSLGGIVSIAVKEFLNQAYFIQAINQGFNDQTNLCLSTKILIFGALAYSYI